MFQDDTILNNIGIRLRKIREAKHLTQSGLANAMGILPNQYGKVENGKVIPSLKTLVRAAQVLEISIDEIIFGKKPIEQIEVEDVELAKKMRIISELPPNDKFVANEMIDLIIAKKTLKDLSQKFSLQHPNFR